MSDGEGAWIARLERSIRRAESPLVALWGPPGSGRAAALEGLMARAGAVAIDEAELAQSEAIEGRLRVARPHWRPEAAGFLGARLGPSTTLVFAADLAPESPRVQGIGPASLALEVGEIETMLVERGRPADRVGECAAAIHAATHGWRWLVLLALDEGLDEAAVIADHRELGAWVRETLLPSLPTERASELLAGALAEGAIPSREPWRGLADQVGVARRVAPAAGATGARHSPRIALPPALVPSLVAEAGRTFGRPRCEAIARRWLLELEGLDRRPSPRRAAATEVVDRRFALRLLGRPSLRRFDPREGWVELTIGASAAWLVLARLTRAGEHGATLDELLEAVGDGDERPTPALHPILSRLRGQLAEPASLRRVGDIYLLGPRREDWWVDVWELERCAAAPRSDEDPVEVLVRLEGVRDLASGPLLAGIDRRWLRDWRRYLRQLRDEAQLRLGAQLARHGRGDAALDLLLALGAEDPTNEAVNVLLMQVYAGMGRRDAVHRCYADLCTAMADDLGVVPSEETTAEYHRLLGL